jgi:polyhydroxyalkanoate synthase subunit PhaE
MNTPFTGAGFRPDAAFTSAAERFFELLKSFSPPGASAAARDWSSLATPLAGQFEQWLRASQSANPWFAAAGSAGVPGAAAAAAFGPLPLGQGAMPQEAQRSFELVARLAQLQGQLAGHWSEIANSAARGFIARLGAGGSSAPTLDNALKLYELWVECAEEAYAATVRKDDFCRLQSELANTSAALLVEQRRHAESLVRAFGLPTRTEVDMLYQQIKDLRSRLGERAPAAAAAQPRRATSKRAAPKRAPPKRGGGRKRAAKPRGGGARRPRA